MESALQHRWQPLQATAQPPAWRGSSLVFDQKRLQMVLFAAGETWLWSGTGWSKAQSQSAPPARNTAHLVYDITTECILLCGGVGMDGSPLHDMWLWDGTTWAEQQPASRPDPVGGAGMVCDRQHRQVIFFGGLAGFDGESGSNRVGEYSNATWIWNGLSWRAQVDGTMPPARMTAQLVYDSIRQQTLLFGGHGPTGYLNDMWLWQGSGWQQITPATPPPTGTRSYTTFHTQLQRILLVRENPDGASSTQRLYQTWLWDGTAWSQNAADQALPGSIEGFAYDDTRLALIASVVTGGKGPLPSKSSGARLPELAAPTPGSETWTW